MGVCWLTGKWNSCRSQVVSNTSSGFGSILYQQSQLQAPFSLALPTADWGLHLAQMPNLAAVSVGLLLMADFEQPEADTR